MSIQAESIVMATGFALEPYLISNLGVNMSHKMYCACRPSRRKFLSGLVGGLAISVLPSKAATPKPTVLGNRDRIDTHHHFFAPSLLSIMMERKRIRQHQPIHASMRKKLEHTGYWMLLPQARIVMLLLSIIISQAH